ncbi:LysR family transcriptional regulator [Aeromonas caviae]|jgi:LysR family transcriptional activator of nhaA|uniref:LysR family transcriptional regulator n=1 Tax=Aeromonas caviae TaxID=648 RepID=A0AA37D0W9_AERCA|nr:MULTISPECIES: LysR family transcriptional regulator [Aeromonas]MBA8783854.1 LysR family transcriptional regulator [Aeromonas caviae]MBA8787851.1 LysR family transcriptional regulator [Aeromonas sp. TW 6]MBL0531213.1 LysR family transcriptional regulator [Aeromonas caviae]MBL0550952.1 LysR family transcriptional regulator [Aeromonas caviae]MBP4060006.1 LysR family transcriptional regulator [Aeromonas sp. Prich7-2]
MLNYKQLYYFWHVARSGGVTRAAQQLHLTPQTISGQVAELEQSLGVALFNRVGRRLVLTAAGRQALEQAGAIFSLGAELEHSLRHASQELTMQVGITASVPRTLAFELLAPAMALATPLRLICHEERPDQLFSELARHKLDMVLTDRPLPPDSGIRGYNHELGRSPLALFASPALAAQARKGFPAALEGLPVLIPGEKSVTHDRLLVWYHQQGIHPHLVGQFDDSALMKSFGKAGMGIFPAPLAMGEEITRVYGVERIATLPEVTLSYYLVSAGRHLSHPGVKAVMEGASQRLAALENKK